MKKSCNSHRNMESINILDVKVHPLAVIDLHKIIRAKITYHEKSIIANVNAHAMNLAFREKWLKDFFNNAAIVFCDGAGVRLAARILGYHIPERITYADWMWQIAEFSSKNNFTFYLLGARKGIAKKAAEQLTKRYPNIQILGVHHGYFNKTVGSRENANIISKINKVKPNILVVAFGMPLQERWLYENWDKIDANIALTGGAVFDYVSGELKRGPRCLTDNGFEWLARLLIEPKRLWKRYIIGNPLFITRIILHRIGILRF